MVMVTFPLRSPVMTTSKFNPHPSYGPCDSFGPGQVCSECARPGFVTTEKWEQWLLGPTHLPMTINQILDELAARIKEEKYEIEEIGSRGLDTAYYNQTLGSLMALQDFRDWILRGGEDSK